MYHQVFLGYHLSKQWYVPKNKDAFCELYRDRFECTWLPTRMGKRTTLEISIYSQSLLYVSLITGSRTSLFYIDLPILFINEYKSIFTHQLYIFIALGKLFYILYTWEHVAIIDSFRNVIYSNNYVTLLYPFTLPNNSLLFYL